MGKTEYLDLIFSRDSAIVSRKIAGEFILVPISQSVEDVDSIYHINEVASWIWDLLEGEKRVEQIRDIIVDEFEVEPDEAEEDIVQFLLQLEAAGAVKRD